MKKEARETRCQDCICLMEEQGKMFCDEYQKFCNEIDICCEQENYNMNKKQSITDITIRIEVDSDTYDDYEKCLDEFCNSLNECYIYRIDIREKQRED